MIAASLSAVQSPVVERRIAGRRIGAGAERIQALDGLRGALAFMVLVSHYIGEVPSGFKAALVGWIAVKMFFVLSGFLMARIISDQLNNNTGWSAFLASFYIRRACRTLPLYVLTIAIVFVSLAVFGDRAWMDADRVFPLWRYLTFTQGFEMVARGDTGTEWLTPTWTLTVEEQFYLVAPLLCLLAGRKRILPVLLVLAGASIAFRLIPTVHGGLPALAGFVLLPSVVHVMLFGMMVGFLFQPGRTIAPHVLSALRIAPIIALGLAALTQLVGGDVGLSYQLIGMPMVAVACAAALAALVHGAPEAQRFEARPLKTLGRLSYGIYLLHMPVLGLMHGLLLGGKPDIATFAQIAVTAVAALATLGLAHVVNRWIEEPMIVLGKRWTTSNRRRTVERRYTVPSTTISTSLGARAANAALSV